MQVDPARVDRAWFQRLNLYCDKLLSNFAFNFILRRYSKEIVVKRSNSAVRLFRIVNEQVKKDALAGCGVSTVHADDDKQTVELVKEIFEDYGYSVKLIQLQQYGVNVNSFFLKVTWSPTDVISNSVSAVWSKTKDIIKAQAALVLQSQKPSADDSDDNDYDYASLDGY